MDCIAGNDQREGICLEREWVHFPKLPDDVLEVPRGLQPSGVIEHSRRDIDSRNALRHLGKCARYDARTTRHIQHRIRRPYRRELNCEPKRRFGRSMSRLKLRGLVSELLQNQLPMGACVNHVLFPLEGECSQ